MVDRSSLLSELEWAQEALDAAYVDAALRGKERKRCIQACLAAGVRPVDIARLTGLSKARITQLKGKS
jgi:hypothetical protein